MNKLILFILLVTAQTVFISQSTAQESVNDLKAQLKIAKKALDSELDNPDLIWNYAGLNLQLGRQTNNPDYLKTASINYDTLHALAPDNPRILLLAYSANYSLIWSGGSTDINHLTKLFDKIDPETKKTLSPPSTVKVLARIAFPNLYDDQSKPVDELNDIYEKSLKEAIKEQPDFILNYQMLSNLYATKEQFLLAVAIAKQGLNKSPDHAGLLHLTGQHYMDQVWSDNCVYNNEKELKNAETYFLKALKKAPKNAQFHTDLSEVYEYQRRRFLTINSAKRAHELNPNLDSFLHIAILETIYGSKDKAEKLYDTVAKKFGDNDALHGKKTLAIYQFDFTKASKLIKINKHSDAYDYLTKGVLGDILGKKKGLEYYAKKALKNTKIKGQKRKLVEFAANKISYEELESGHTSSCDLIESSFYQAYKTMQSGDKLASLNQFKKILDLDFQSYYEHLMAGYFVGKLENQ